MKTDTTAPQISALNDHDIHSPKTIAVYSRPEAPKPEQLFYDIDQTAFALNVCPKTVRRFLARGKLTSCKVLRKILIPRAQIEAFLKATCDKPNFE